MTESKQGQLIDGWVEDTKVNMVDAMIKIMGEESFAEGTFAPERVVHISEVNIIQRTCAHCGTVVTGPDYNVWHIMAAHEVGHLQDAQQLAFNVKIEDDDDDNGGVPV